MELGFEVELDVYGSGTNVIGRKLGNSRPNEAVLVGAHYDSVPDCSGADDNASGVAGVLELARVFADIETERTLIVACWDEEELGLVGSRNFAGRAVLADEAIQLVVNFDMIAYKSDQPMSQTLPDGFDLFFLLYPDQAERFESNDRRADFIFWISDSQTETSAPLIARYGEEIGLPTLGGVLPEGLESNAALADLRRSDHASFWEQSIPALFLTDTANLRYGGYHCADGDDSIDRLDHEFATQVIQATVGTVAELLQL
jgi:Zn-dependent M28 family amino/carboxypeptidase